MPEVNPSSLSIADAARELRVSESWLYRHKNELPHTRVGRLIRFDALLLRRHFQSKYPVRTGNRLNPERRNEMGLKRYQRGYVYKTGKRIKVWYGMWREDVRQADGGFVRRRRNERLGKVTELPTRSAAYEELTRRMAIQSTSVAMKFSELVERWKQAVLPTIKPATANYYVKILGAHILPAFGDRDIQDIGRFDLEKFLAERSRSYCRNSLRGMRVSFGRVMSWAVDCGWLEKNPASGVRLPNAPSRIKRTILTPEQIYQIAQKLNEPYATLVLFLAVTGLRIGEAIGIRWEDFDGDMLSVRRRIYEGKPDTLKTKSSVRDLPIPASLLTRMRALGGSEWVFRSRAGTPINPGNALKRYVRPAIRELGIPIGGWHDFRHTLATRSLRKWPTKVVSGILGHSDVRTTMAIYQHVDTDEFRGPMDEIASELARSGTKSAAAD